MDEVCRVNALEWIPEVYARSGGLAAAGFYKLLGRPRLDPLTVLVRETAQNSWDARLQGEDVRFYIDGWTPMYPDEVRALREVVFPHSDRTQTGLAKLLSKKAFDGLIISDRGTRGLGGPLVADEVAADGVYDWVDFILNIGKPNTAGHTGGTYGFGKTITYIVSSVSTIVVHSRTMYKGRPQTRLIGCAIGEEFKHGGRLHTGRHWWGVNDGGAPAPVTGANADEIATAIGMPAFARGEFGTNILVVGPDWGGRTPEQAMRFIAESVTWHLWPKLMEHEKRRPPMSVEISWDNEPVPVPKPEERPPLHGFAQAFRALLDGVPEGRRPDGLERVVIRTQRPAKEVGDLVMVPLVARERAEVDDGHDKSNEDANSPAASIDGICHHTALLRVPELVVDYVPGPLPQDGGSEWAAVFRCRKDVDEHFAMAEPPTHDSWRPELLPKSNGKTFVRVGLQRIKEAVDSRWGYVASSDAPTSGASTAVVADELAHLIRAMPSIGPGRTPSGPKGSPGIPSPRAGVDILEAGVVLLKDEPASEATIRVTPKRGSDWTTVSIEVAAALDDSSTDADSQIDPLLEIVDVRADGATVELDGRRGQMRVSGDTPVDFVVLVRRSPDTSVSFDVRAEPVRTE